MSLTGVIGGILTVGGVLFLLLGTLGLLRFPDVYTRLHAQPKADNIGLGMICLGLGVYSGSLPLTLKLLLVWLLMLVATAVGAGLIARAALRRGIRPWGL